MANHHNTFLPCYCAGLWLRCLLKGYDYRAVRNSHVCKLILTRHFQYSADDFFVATKWDDCWPEGSAVLGFVSPYPIGEWEEECPVATLLHVLAWYSDYPETMSTSEKAFCLKKLGAALAPVWLFPVDENDPELWIKKGDTRDWDYEQHYVECGHA